jgi:hypothetical protein
MKGASSKEGRRYKPPQLCSIENLKDTYRGLKRTLLKGLGHEKDFKTNAKNVKNK